MRKIALGFAFLSIAALTVQADTYSYTGPNNGTWSTAGNWSDTTTGTTATTPPSTTSDVANVSISGGNQTVIYDASSTGNLGTLNLTNSGSGTNELDMQKSSLHLTNALTLGSANGFSTLFEDGVANKVATSINVGGAGMLLNAGGVLENHGWVSSSISTDATITGALTIAGGEFIIDEALFNTTSGNPGAASTVLTSNFTMSSGTVAIGASTTIPVGSGDSFNTDTRLTTQQNVNITGGAITAPTVNATLQLEGASSILDGVSLASSLHISVITSNINPTLSTDQILNNGFTDRANNATPTINTTLQFTDTNTTSTGNVGAITFQPSNNAVQTLQLGSNLKTISGASPFALVSASLANGGTESLTVDMNGFNYDVTNTGSVFAPITSGVTGNSLGWTFTNSSVTNASTLKAVGFNLSSATSTTIGANTTLESTGGAATANNLGDAAGTINAGSTFLYAGNATAASEALLISNRTIGGLAVQNGALNINQVSLTAGGAVAVSNSGTLDLNGTSVGTLTLASGKAFTATTGSMLELTLNMSGASDQIVSSGGGAGFTLNNVTLSLNSRSGNSINYADSYTVLSGFTGLNSITNLSIIGYDTSDFVASLSDSGVLSFSEVPVPEPSEWAMMLGGLAMLTLVQLRRRAKV